METEITGLEQPKNTEETNKQPYFERTKLEDTPFTIISEKKEGEEEIHYGVMGDYRVTEPFETKEAVKKYILRKPWELLTTFISIAIEKIIEQRDNK